MTQRQRQRVTEADQDLQIERDRQTEKQAVESCWRKRLHRDMQKP